MPTLPIRQRLQKVKKAGLFIDVQNLYGVGKKLGSDQRISYRALKHYFEQRYDLVKATAFTCYNPDYKNQKNFMAVISGFGFRVVSKPIRRLFDGYIKANCDMEMALEILRTAASLDVVVLVTGDSDFVSLVNELSMLGKQVLLVYSAQARETASPTLMQACDELLTLETIPDAIRKKPQPNEPDEGLHEDEETQENEMGSTDRSGITSEGDASHA